MENNQPQFRVKCLVGRSRITSLSLDDPKKQIMNDSQFSTLCNMSNGKESSATLLQALCQFYDVNNDVFIFNDDTSLTFCAKEVASMLSVEDSGEDLDLRESTHVPPFACELRDKYCKDKVKTSSANPLTTADLKVIIQGIEIIDDKSRLIFKKLMSFYVVDQFLCASTNKKGRNKYWSVVEDLALFESINWAKVACKHLKDELKSLQLRLNDPSNAEKELHFGGCTPVLEAIIYGRISSLSPKKFTTHPPNIQMYQPQRKSVDQWPFSRLTSDQILECPFCCVRATADDSGDGDGMITPARDLLKVTNMLDGVTISEFDEGTSRRASLSPASGSRGDGSGEGNTSGSGEGNTSGSRGDESGSDAEAAVLAEGLAKRKIKAPNRLVGEISGRKQPKAKPRKKQLQKPKKK